MLKSFSSDPFPNLKLQLKQLSLKAISDKNNFIKDYQSIKIKKYFDINLNESDIYKYRFESDKINPNE